MQASRRSACSKRCDALLTGYVGDAALADVVLDTARRVRAANPRAVWCCDPVLGDVDTGLYVRPSMPSSASAPFRPATWSRPTISSSKLLTGRTVATLDDALAAARTLAARAQLMPWSPACAAPTRRPTRSRCWRSAATQPGASPRR